MKIIQDKEIQLLNIRDIDIEIDHSGSTTPKKEELRKKVADFLKTPEELVAVKHVYTRFGEGKSNIIASVYEKKETFDYFEKKKVKKVKESGQKEKKK